MLIQSARVTDPRLQVPARGRPSTNLASLALFATWLLLLVFMIQAMVAQQGEQGC